jgi:mono/diheme cytochrome c family protein
VRRSLALLALIGCARGLPPPGAPVLPVRAEAVPALEGERVIAAADDGTRRLLLTGQAAWIFRGAAFERTAGSRPWKKAAFIPAADGRGTWCVGLDDGGRLWRVRPGADLEEISDRYALSRERLRDVAAAGGRLVAFLGEQTVAVADGRRVIQYPAAGARSLSGGGRRLAVLYPDHLDILELGGLAGDARPSRRRYDLAALAAAVDGRGVVYAATSGGVYRADGASLKLVHAAGARIRWLTAAGPRVWFADGDTLMALDDAVAGAQGAPPIPLAPIAAGDGSLWLVERGRVTHLVPSQASPAEERWTALVSPVFDRACAGCHRPDGKSGVDLSTAAAWLGARDELRERVLVRRTMPPAGKALAEDDRAAIAAWMSGLVTPAKPAMP